MNRLPFPRWLLATLILAAVVLPLAQAVLFWVEKLLAAMDDGAGASFVARLILACGIVWAIDLALLVIAVAIWCFDSEPPPSE